MKYILLALVLWSCSQGRIVSLHDDDFPGTKENVYYETYLINRHGNCEHPLLEQKLFFSFWRDRNIWKLITGNGRYGGPDPLWYSDNGVEYDIHYTDGLWSLTGSLEIYESRYGLEGELRLKNENCQESYIISGFPKEIF